VGWTTGTTSTVTYSASVVSDVHWLTTTGATAQVIDSDGGMDFYLRFLDGSGSTANPTATSAFTFWEDRPFPLTEYLESNP